MDDPIRPERDPGSARSKSARATAPVSRAPETAPSPPRRRGKRTAEAVLGSLDQADPDGTISGWCWSPDRPSDHRQVVISIGGREVVRIAADVVRDDLRQAGIGDGDHGFLVSLDETAMVTGERAVIAAYDSGTGQSVGGVREVVWNAEARFRRGAAEAPLAPLDGTLDRVTRDGWVSGWTRDPELPDERVELEVLVEDEVVGTTVAAGFRADLQAAGIGDGGHGFSFALPYEIMATRGTMTILVRERRADGRTGRVLGEPVMLRIGRVAAAEQRVQDLERQVRLLRGQLDALTRDAVERPQADQRAAQALFGAVAGFFQELSDGAPAGGRTFGTAPMLGGGLRGAIEDIATRLAPITLRLAERPTATVCIPATASVEAIHRCLLAIHEAGIDGQADIMVIEPQGADPRIALLPSVVRNLNFVHLSPGQTLVGGCDEAARTGRGDVVAFLSPDCLPQRGWLSELVETFAREPTASVVGAVVIRADGLLQHSGFDFEPGGLLGDPGQFSEVDRPAYSHLRAVDAVAGLAVAIDRPAYAAADGFARSFATLTGAVVDLCARLRRPADEGFATPVMIQSSAQALWADTADTDPFRTLPDLARPDEEARRIRLALLSAGVNAPVLAHHALVIDNDMPRPDRDAGSIITLEQLRLLHGLGWRVTFAPALGGVVEPAARRRLEREGIEVVTPPHMASLTHYLREHGAGLALVQIFRHANARMLTDRVREFAPGARLVFAPADLHFVREIRESQLTGRGRAEADATCLEELSCVRAADATLLHSDYELVLLQRDTSIDPRRLHLLRWIVSPVAAPPPFEGRAGMAFVANFAHPPNVDAMLWFCAEVMPLLRAQRPGLVLHIVGGDPPASVAALAAEDIVVRGYVADLDALMGQMRLTIAPLRYGAGFKGKVATSLAHGVPAVITPSAAEGMGLADGDGVVIRPDPASFAAVVAQVHDDPRAWAALSARALDRVAALYSPATAREAYLGLLSWLGLDQAGFVRSRGGA